MKWVWVKSYTGRWFTIVGNQELYEIELCQSEYVLTHSSKERKETSLGTYPTFKGAQRGARQHQA